MKPLFLILLSITSSALFASQITRVVVDRSVDLKIEQSISLPFNKSEGLLLREVWRSPAGIVCKVNMFGFQPEPEIGTFECESQDGYKAQISFDCANNNSKETSAYLFFGHVGERGETSNFYVWCE